MFGGDFLPSERTDCFTRNGASQQILCFRMKINKIELLIILLRFRLIKDSLVLGQVRFVFCLDCHILTQSAKSVSHKTQIAK